MALTRFERFTDRVFTRPTRAASVFYVYLDGVGPAGVIVPINAVRNRALNVLDRHPYHLRVCFLQFSTQEGNYAGGSPVRPELALLLGVTAVSFAAPLIKLSEAPPVAIAFYRLAFAAAATFLLARGRPGRLPDRRSTELAALAGLFLGLHFAVWIASLSYTSVVNSVVLVTLQPVITALASRLLFREHLNRRAILGITLALVGGLALAGGDLRSGAADLYGDALAFLGAIFVAAYFLVGRALRRTVSTLTYTFWVYGTAAGVLLFLALVTRTPLGPYGPGDWLIFAGLALVCTLLGHSVFNWALAYLPATSVTVAILGEPIGAGLLALLLFHEAPRLGQLLAGAVLLSGIAVYLSAPVPAATPPPQGVNHFNSKAS